MSPLFDHKKSGKLLQQLQVQDTNLRFISGTDQASQRNGNHWTVYFSAVSLLEGRKSCRLVLEIKMFITKAVEWREVWVSEQLV